MGPLEKGAIGHTGIGEGCFPTSSLQTRDESHAEGVPLRHVGASALFLDTRGHLQAIAYGDAVGTIISGEVILRVERLSAASLSRSRQRRHSTQCDITSRVSSAMLVTVEKRGTKCA